MEIVTSWERKAQLQTREEVAIKALQKGMMLEMIVEITGLSLERVQELQVQQQSEN